MEKRSSRWAYPAVWWLPFLFIAILFLTLFVLMKLNVLSVFEEDNTVSVSMSVMFANDFEADERERFLDLFKDTEFGSGIVLQKYFSFQALNQEDLILYQTLVPVTDFYETLEKVSQEEVWERYLRGEGLKEINDLSASQKLLSVGEDYFLDNPERGALYIYIMVKANGAEEGQDNGSDLALAKDKLQTIMEKPVEKDKVLTFVQTGVTALSRWMNSRLSRVGDATYFSKDVAEFLKSADLTHTSNESSFTNYADQTNICSKPDFINTLTDIGLDIVELTGNHNLDCGIGAALDSIDKYEELGIKIVGGGRNAEEAAHPLEINQKDTQIVMLAYNQSTGGATRGDYPGANQYYEEDAAARINEAKALGKIVIVDVQYYECNEYADTFENTYCDRANSSAGDQIGLFRSLIEMGADIVVGTAAHQTQTFEKYNDGYIYYGLGNLFFDQSWWPGTTRSLGLKHYFYNGKLVQTKRFGTVYGDDLAPRIMTEEELAWFVDRLNQSRP